MAKTVQNKKLFIRTFGCQMNEHDSERIAGMLKQEGYELCQRPEEADLVILNTCSIRENAEQKAYSELGRLQELKQEKPDLLIGVAGCTAQREGEKILKRMPCVDFIFGSPNIDKTTELLKQAVQQKRQRFQQGQRILQFDGFLEHQRRVHWNQCARNVASRQFLQPQAARAQPADQPVFRQPGQIRERMNAPQVESPENFGIGRQAIEGERSQNARLLAGWEECEAGQIPRRQDRRLHSCGNGHLKGGRDLRKLARGDGEHRRRVVDNFYPGRE